MLHGLNGRQDKSVSQNAAVCRRQGRHDIRTGKTLCMWYVQVSINDFVLKAVAAALRDVPTANVFWNEKVEGGTVQQYSSIDISVAVATERGLITPIVKNADTKSLQQVCRQKGDANKGWEV